MAEHNELGRKGEYLAEVFLKTKGFEILHRNWRHGHYEIDIVALREKLLHFVEVKARKFSPNGHPEDSVSKKKFRFLLAAADEYLHRYPGHKHIQFDILAITLFSGKEPDFLLIEDVYL